MKRKLKISNEEYETLNFDQKMTYLTRLSDHYGRILKVVRVIQVIVFIAWAITLLMILAK